MFNILTNVVANGVEESEKLTGWSTVTHILSAAANFFISIGFSISIVGVAFALIQFIISSGDPKQIDKAKQAITWSAVALIISALLVALKNVLLHSLGVTDADLTNDNPTF